MKILQNNFLRFILISWVLCNPSYALASCLPLVNKIYKEINSHSSPLLPNQFPWMQLSWLEKNLGNQYQKESLDNKVQYTWHCTEGDAFLSITMNANHQITNLNGQYSTEEGSGLFSSLMPVSYAPPPPPMPSPPPPESVSFKPVAPQIKPIEHPSRTKVIVLEQEKTSDHYLNLKLTSYNEIFKTSFTTKEQILNDNLKRLRKYSANLRHCNTGNYSYAILQHSGRYVLYFSSIKKKLKKNVCLVETSFNLEGKKIAWICRFTPHDVVTAAARIENSNIHRDQSFNGDCKLVKN